MTSDVVDERRDVERFGVRFRARRFTIAPSGIVLLDALWAWGAIRNAPRDPGSFQLRDHDGSWWVSCEREEMRKVITETFPDSQLAGYWPNWRAFRES